ncbi:uncharacterized protein LOC110453751 [Mizuhopecten yessoensis]|uniref:Uncharacterized protein n=1 Tax=Mizuhopecten yessoensis TaxID=6573 RepID=A0A210QGQ4_MIZYE|nr:uncharacterized protein LOC110453751 [Mizuhopecten yessoensis]XP_021358555.1 uncharacterized protein LOC110453751 [Mizuhopecten yessoensis]XP_021358556.1 uncharacterized protein LOC110453751 [Mizuhopecten yessoensis]XP_021358557.1 uncharacterized protein LOC110453751 [Mizuhopecten yessoensis]XP_021358558.1 uncharacterized protein LOC110453751 [Mizuhopecten yessoensis]XP_021358559.1 uncharacterized protein LOC110453751 [Mizuhopecten yessoensis]XP_021358561.1 uncharacterized protein LOC11045
MMFGHAQTEQHIHIQSRDKQVKDMVKKMVLNLENLQGNLQQVVSDLRTLVDQIDSVTAKIDKTYGTKWRREEKSPSSKTARSPSNIPRRTGRNGDDVKRDLLRVEETRAWDASPDLDLSYLQISPGEHRSRWGRSLVLSDPLNISSNAERTPKRSFSLGTDMGDYVGAPLQDLLQNDTVCGAPRQAPKRSISVNTDMTDNSGVSVQTCIPVPVAKCFAQIKHNVVEEEMTLPKPEVDISPDSKSSGESVDHKPVIAVDVTPEDGINTLYGCFGAEASGSSASGGGYTGGGIPYDLLNSKIVNVDSSSEHGSYSTEDYDGMYERLMENQLENMSASSDCTDLTESSEYNMDLGSLDKSDTTSFSDDIEVRYDRDINTWTSYTLAHMNSSARSSDSCLSETPSDILNDNTQATVMYGNMIFSDQLVVLNSRKHRRKRLQRDHITNNAVDIP